MARLRRVSDDQQRAFFERLNRTGELAVLLAILEDEGDGLHETIQAILGGDILHDAKQLAHCQARQGALGAVRDLGVKWKQLGSRMAAAQQARDEKAAGSLASAPQRVSV